MIVLFVEQATFPALRREYIFEFDRADVPDRIQSDSASESTEWRSLQYGKPITSKRLNQKLREYQIRPVKRRDSNVYLFSDIEDNLRRYLP